MIPDIVVSLVVVNLGLKFNNADVCQPCLIAESLRTIQIKIAKNIDSRHQVCASFLHTPSVKYICLHLYGCGQRFSPALRHWWGRQPPLLEPGFPSTYPSENGWECVEGY